MATQVQGNADAKIKIEFVPPWERIDAFPEKPQGQDYGYYLRGKFVECSSDELIQKCRAFPPVHLAWCPAVARVAPVTEIDFLSETLRARDAGQFKSTMTAGLSNCFLWGLLTVLSTGRSVSWMLLLFIMIGVIPTVNGFYGLRKLKRAGWAADESEIKIGRYSAWVLSQRILFTWLLLAGIGVVFVLECINGFPESASRAGLDKPAVWRGEWWRLFTGPLLHGSVMHFLFNASALVGLGRLTEVLASRFHLAIVFATAALTGSILSLFLLPSDTSVGASGGLLGLIGFLTILGVKRKRLLPPGFAKSLAINIALLAAMGIMAFSVIDNAAHLGGFLAGLILGSVLVTADNPIVPLEAKMNVKIAGTLMLITTAGFAIFSMIRIFEN